MATFVLIPGAGGSAWYWSRVAPLLRDAGHTALPIDLPGDDETAALDEYTRIVLDAIDGRSDVALVGQSLGGFTAAMAAASVPVTSLTFVNAMIPQPGETAGAWWGNTGATEARDAEAAAAGYGEFDVQTYFLHDVPADVAAEGEPYQRPEADAVFGSPCNFAAWPDIPIRAVVGRDDRFFPPAFQVELVRTRLGLEADVLPGGHLIAVSQPHALATHLLQGLAL